MAACRFLESKAADHNLKYKWFRSFLQVSVCHPKQLHKYYPAQISSAAHVFLKLFSLSHTDSPR